MSWDVVKQGDPEKLDDEIKTTIKTNGEVVEDMISKISKELRRAHEHKYTFDEAEKTAALCLLAQKELSEFLSDAELRAKERKLKVETTEAEKFVEYKNSETKITDTVVKSMVAKDPLVISSKKDYMVNESTLIKWRNLFGFLKESHIFFRGLSRGKNEWG